MLLFDIGANRGDATIAGLNKGYKVIALEPAPRVFAELVSHFIYSPDVVPLRYAVSDTDYQTITFYECAEDGLSTTNLEWLTNDALPYAGKPYRAIKATTITIDALVAKYGEPDLMKIDVEGGEWATLRGMTRKYGTLAIEWTLETLAEHEAQLDYLAALGYTEYAPQYIEHHLTEPEAWYPLSVSNAGALTSWQTKTCREWIHGGWKVANLRPTADVGMLWVRG